MIITVNVPTEIHVDSREVDKPFWVVYRRDAAVYRSYGYKTRRGADAAAARANSMYPSYATNQWVVVDNLNYTGGTRNE